MFHKKKRKPNFYNEIDEVIASSVEYSGSEDEERKSKEPCYDFFESRPRKKKRHIDLKELNENDFLDLIAAKN